MPLIDQKMLREAALFRGGFLNGFIYLEKLIDVYLSMYFSSNDDIKRDELMDLLFAKRDGMPMYSKKVLLINVLENRDITFYKENEKFIKSIGELIEDRNIIAHYLLDRSDYGRNNFMQKSKTLTFVKFDKQPKKGENKVLYTPIQIDMIIQKLEDCIEKAKELIERIDADFFS